jgi:hypothetical protein
MDLMNPPGEDFVVVTPGDSPHVETSDERPRIEFVSPDAPLSEEAPDANVLQLPEESPYIERDRPSFLSPSDTDPEDSMSIDPFDSNQPQYTDTSPQEAPDIEDSSHPSIASDLREAIINLAGDSPVDQFAMGVVAGAVTIVAEPTYMVMDMGSLIYNSIDDPTNFHPEQEQWGSDMATYIVEEMEDGRDASDMSGELLGNMAIDVPTLGLRHVPDMVETITNEDTTPGERGVAAFNLGMILYGARQGARGYGNIARRTRSMLTTGTERLQTGINEIGLSSTDLRLRAIQIEADLLNYEGPGAISDRGAQSLTVAVAEGIDLNNLETTTPVGTNSHQANSLITRLRLLRPNEVLAPSVRVGGSRVSLPANLHHAELSTIRYLLNRGIEIGRVATSRPGCSSCQINMAADAPGFTHLNPEPFNLFTAGGGLRLHVRWLQQVGSSWFRGLFNFE